MKWERGKTALAIGFFLFFEQLCETSQNFIENSSKLSHVNLLQSDKKEYIYIYIYSRNTLHKKMKFSIKDFSKCDQIRSFFTCLWADPAVFFLRVLNEISHNRGGHLVWKLNKIQCHNKSLFLPKHWQECLNEIASSKHVISYLQKLPLQKFNLPLRTLISRKLLLKKLEWNQTQIFHTKSKIKTRYKEFEAGNMLKVNSFWHN